MKNRLKYSAIVALFAIVSAVGCAKREKTIRYTDSNGNDVSLFTVAKGEGSPILFIHGNSCDHTIWDKQLNATEFGKYKLISYDLRGHGRSVKYRDEKRAASEYSLKLHAEDLRKVIENYKDQNLVVVGWSLGGTILLRYLIDYPDPMISRAVILGTVPSNGFSDDRNFPAAALTPTMGFLISAILMNPEPKDDFREMYIKAGLGNETDVTKLGELPPDLIKQVSEVVKNTDGYSRLGLVDGLGEIIKDLEDGKLDMPAAQLIRYNIYQAEMTANIPFIKTPVRVLVSDNDYWPAEQFNYMQKLNPEYFSTKDVGKNGHAVFFSNPEVFNKDLSEFINEN